MALREKHSPDSAGQPSRIRAEPAAERAFGTGVEKSTQYFSLFLSAVSHEVGNALMAFRIVPPGKISRGQDLAILGAVESYNRLRGLNCLSADMADIDLEGKLSMLFPGFPEFSEAKSTEQKQELIESLKLKTVRELRIALRMVEWEFSGEAIDSRSEAEIERALKCGNMLCNSLEKILLGDYDLSSERIAQRVLGRSSLFKTLVTASAECRVNADVTELDSSLGEVRVVSNPLIAHLVFTNLLSNARRASEMAGRAPLVHIFLNQSDEQVHFRFQDYGCGMDVISMALLNQGVQHTTKSGEGHGIGFSYCRSLVSSLGGSLSVEYSEIGKGTTVLLALAIASDLVNPL